MKWLFDWLRISLRRQLTVGLGGLMAVVMLAFVWTLTDREEKELLNRHQDSAHAMVRALVASSGTWVAARDLVGLQEIVSSLASYPDFEAAMHLDVEGRVLSHSDRKHVGRYVADLPARPQPKSVMDGRGHVDLTYPVLVAGGHVGWVRLVISGDTLQATTRDIREQGMVYAMFGLFVTMLLSSWGGATVTRRLSAIRAVTDAVKAGNRDSRVRLKGADEVAHLANDLDGMLDTIQSQSYRLQAVIDGTGVGTWEWNVITNEVDFNDQWASMFGYSKSELQPMDISLWNNLTLEEDRQNSQMAFEAHIKGQEPFYEAEYRVKHKQGHLVWVLARGRAMERTTDGKAVRMFGTMTDITSRKLAEAELRENRDQLHALFANTPIGIARLTLDGRYLDANASLQHMLGRTLAELQTMHFRDLTALECHEADAQYMTDLLRKGINGPYEKRYIRPDQSTVHGRINSVLVRSAGEEPFIWNVIEDVTTQKAMEATLREARSHAEQASQAKSQFVANMSHEIRTPLNAVLGMLQLLQRTALTERQVDYVDKCEGAAQSLLALLNDILDYSKVEAGKLVLDPDQFQPVQLLDDLSTILAGNLKGRRIEVVFDVDPDLPTLLVGDALRLKQILINLCGNAIKFTPHGEVVLHLAVVTGGTQAKAGEVELEFRVRDTGIGIAPEVQEKIFSGFTQAESSTTRKFGGTGLGLYISQRLVQMMGGHLSLASAPGQGSTFSFRLVFPVVEARRTEPKPVHVLVVEPHAESRVAFEKVVRSLGWSASVVADRSGAEAAWTHSKAAGGTHIDAVLVDRSVCVGDTGWNGCDLCAAMLAESPPPALLVSGYGDEDAMQSVQTLLDAGGGWVPKPLSALAVRRAFKQAQQRLQSGTGGFGSTQGGALGPGSEWAGLPQASAHQQRLAGLRLLLVEDNPINQQVARELLMGEGAEVDVAENGQLAVDALSAADQRFDLVLMDMQMPVMDGLQATHVIRQRLGLGTLPVVAMTANAMAQDKAACMDAGMNDHVGKPFSLDELVRTVLRWTRGESAAQSVAAGAGDSVSPQAVPQWISGLSTDADRLDAVGALQRLGGDPTFYARVLRGFLDTLPGLEAELAHQSQTDELPRFAASLHTLKGSAATAGLKALSACAAQAEQAVKAAVASTSGQPHPDADRWQAHWMALQAEWPHSLAVAGSALEQLQAHLQANQPGGGAPEVSREEWMASLRQMVALLVASDMDVLDRYDTLAEVPGFQSEPELAAFRSAMEAMDFETALVELQEWLRDQPMQTMAAL